MLTSDGIRLAVRTSGNQNGVPVLQLSGGPGCVNYLPDARLDSPARVFAPDPRGAGKSEGGPHDLDRTLADLEEIRADAGFDSWVVVGHSSGADHAVAYALEYPGSVRAVVAACGTGLQNDRDWSATYHALKDTEPPIDVEYDKAVHQSLIKSWRTWIKQPTLLSRLSRLALPVNVVVAGNDIRPSWPLEQLAALLPRGILTVVPDVPHDFWHTHPALWHYLIDSAAN